METMWIDLIGYIGTAIFLVSYAMDGMVKLRLIGLISSFILLAYGTLKGAYPIVVEEALFIPVNAYGLFKMIRLIRQSKEAAQDYQTIELLKPFATRVTCEAGQTLFHLGDPAHDMFCITSGLFRLKESGIELKPGAIVGEFGFISPGNLRTQTLECQEGGVLLRISYDLLKQLYFQNPEFGLYFLRLVTQRLFENQAKALTTPSNV